MQDIDLARRNLMVFGKGEKSRVLPLRGRIVLELEAYMLTPLELVDRTPEPRDHLLYPEKRTAGGRLLAAYPTRQLSTTAMHRWWYSRAREAGFVGQGVTSGLNMHRARHTFATAYAASLASTPRTTSPRALRPQHNPLDLRSPRRDRSRRSDGGARQISGHISAGAASHPYALNAASSITE